MCNQREKELDRKHGVGMFPVTFLLYFCGFLSQVGFYLEKEKDRLSLSLCYFYDFFCISKLEFRNLSFVLAS